MHITNRIINDSYQSSSTFHRAQSFYNTFPPPAAAGCGYVNYTTAFVRRKISCKFQTSATFRDCYGSASLCRVVDKIKMAATIMHLVVRLKTIRSAIWRCPGPTVALRLLENVVKVTNQEVVKIQFRVIAHTYQVSHTHGGGLRVHRGPFSSHDPTFELSFYRNGNINP